MHSDVSDSIPVRFGRMAPTLSVADIGRSVAFYTEALGFEKVFENGSPVGFVILRRDAAELHLTLKKSFKASTQNVAHLMVDDAAALYVQAGQRGVRIVKAIRDADFGLRCFVLADPDGNRIDVGQMLASDRRDPAPSDAPKPGAVVYAKDPARVSAFYAGVAGLEIVHAEADHIVLESSSFQLVVLATPQAIAALIAIASPPERRTRTPVKLVFQVPSIAESRAAAARLGGELNPPGREWTFGLSRVCDGHDPEGNVLQLREPA